MSQAKNKAVLNVTIVGKYLSITKTRQDTISQNQVRLYAKKINFTAGRKAIHKDKKKTKASK